MSNIHQEVSFNAPPAKVYRLLVDAAQFAAFTGAPATGEETEGARFTGFGGYVSGRHLELQPDRRVVQAWRGQNWAEGVYSIARFELKSEGEGTRLIFDHDAFPAEQEVHLAAGWHANYWEKIAKPLG